ncbi:MAG TPA: galactokinase [Candidatus Tumulicola sp.]|nr:galactokinase [Candidatus Tumulicola sp.]
MRAPGRVNLIGEHTDYNDGFVMPAAIALQTRVHAVARADRTIAIRSDSTPEPAAFDLDQSAKRAPGDWSRYARAVVSELQAAGIALPGADLRVESDVPIGAGLSSSAAFEIAVALAMLALGGVELPRIDVARLAQRAEVERVGVNCGIMDQFAVLFGSAGAAVVLDTRSLRYGRVALPSEASLVICNTMVRRALAGQAYNERRAQCQRAVGELRRWYPGIASLRDVTLSQLAAHAGEMTPLLQRRARHVVSENARVLDAADYLRCGNVSGAGALMNESHDSLRDDYEVSCTELDAMVAIARVCEGVYGARMTGGGFGGCTVNLVDRAAVPAFRRRVIAEYGRQMGIVPEIYDGTPSAGASYG